MMIAIAEVVLVSVWRTKITNVKNVPTKRVPNITDSSRTTLNLTDSIDTLVWRFCELANLCEMNWVWQSSDLAVTGSSSMSDRPVFTSAANDLVILFRRFVFGWSLITQSTWITIRVPNSPSQSFVQVSASTIDRIQVA